ncbi:MAG TPA: TfoX/Sxy family protein [bacterium]|nr:TfoX/Sxy family protein [bacterium]
MFGGTSFYSHGRIFAIIARGDLYLREIDKNATILSEMNTPLFEYPRKDGTIGTMRYRRVSADVLEDRERLTEYARIAGA